MGGDEKKDKRHSRLDFLNNFKTKKNTNFHTRNPHHVPHKKTH